MKSKKSLVIIGNIRSTAGSDAAQWLEARRQPSNWAKKLDRQVKEGASKVGLHQKNTQRKTMDECAVQKAGKGEGEGT